MLGITFANPLALHGLWAALLPALIHLLNRRRAVTVPFSNVALLKALQQDRMRRVKVKQLLLLVLRTLVVLALVLAFARPSLPGSVAAVGRGAPTSAVLLLDRSLSMRYRTPRGTLFERAKARARDALGLFGARDEVALYLVDDRCRRVEGAHVPRLLARLDGLSASYRATDFGVALEKAQDVLAQASTPNRELFLFTDLARNGWGALPDSLSGLRGVSVYAVPERPDRWEDLGVLRARLEDEIVSVGTQAALRVELANYGRVARPEVAVQARVGKRPVARQLVHMGPEDTVRIRVPFIFEESGTVPIRVSIGDDSLPENNVYATSLSVPAHTRVLLVGGTPADTYYLAHALSALDPGRSTLTLTRAVAEALTSDALESADVTFLCNVQNLGRGLLGDLRRRVQDGGGLCIILGTATDVRYYNERLLPALLPSSIVSVTGTPGQDLTHRSLSLPVPGSPVFRGIADTVGSVGPRVYACFSVRPGEHTQTVASLSDGLPLLLAGGVGEGRVFLIACPADLDWTDLPLTGLWVPFVHRLARHLASSSEEAGDYAAGTSVVRRVRGEDSGEAVVRAPGGEERTVWPERRGGRNVWNVGDVEEPGIWRIRARGTLVDLFAVHTPGEESDPAGLSPESLASLLPGASVRVLAPADPLADAVAQQRRGRELWRVLLGFALALLAVESLVLRSTQTSREQRG